MTVVMRGSEMPGVSMISTLASRAALHSTRMYRKSIARSRVRSAISRSRSAPAKVRPCRRKVSPWVIQTAGRSVAVTRVGSRLWPSSAFRSADFPALYSPIRAKLGRRANQAANCPEASASMVRLIWPDPESRRTGPRSGPAVRTAAPSAPQGDAGPRSRRPAFAALQSRVAARPARQAVAAFQDGR